MQRLKQTEIASTRTTLLESQGNLCAICGHDCSADPVLDHDHKTGAIRAVLHRGCNALLGRIENNAARHGVSRDELPAFLHGAAGYLNTHSSAQSDLEHPTHRTAEERAVAAKARAKRRRQQRVVSALIAE